MMVDMDNTDASSGTDDLYARARAELETAQTAGDELRLKALEDLYRSLEGQLEDPGSGAR